MELYIQGLSEFIPYNSGCLQRVAKLYKTGPPDNTGITSLAYNAEAYAWIVGASRILFRFGPIRREANEVQKMCSSELMIESRADSGAIVKTDKPRLIVLDDSPDWGKFVSEVAEKVGFSGSAATSYGDYAGIAKAEPPDVLVLDLFMPEKDGIEIILGMEHLDDRPFIILISGKSRSFLESAVSLGQGKGLDIIGALAKPFRLPDLKAMLQKAANLVEQKKKLGNEIGAMHSTQRTEAKPCNMMVDYDQITKHDLQESDDSVAGETKQVMAIEQSFGQEAPGKFGNVASFPATENSIRRSIAAINAQFCLMLWDTQLATLNALNIVPSRLTEAAADLIASIASAEETSSWHEALSIHTQTLVDNQAAIREIADTLRLPGRGRSATESIDRISTIVSEILAEKRTKSASYAEMLASFRKLCSENGRLNENFAALLIAVNNALALVHDAAVGRAARGAIQSRPTSPQNHRNNALQRVENSRILEG